MCYESESFVNYQPCESWQVVFSGGNTIPQIARWREVEIKLLDGKVKQIPNVLHVSSFKKNLVFAKQFDKFGGKISIRLGVCMLNNPIGEKIA
jgi:hypothetical protein